MMTNWLNNARRETASLLHPEEVPARYRDKQLSDVPNKGLQACALKYSKHFWEVAPQGIAPLFVGKMGTYKTWTAAAIARGIRAQYLIDVAWCNCAAEFARFDREAFASTTAERIAWLKAVPFLVMDDFTQVPRDTRMWNTLVEIGSERYDNQRPTLWTGNVELKKDDFSALEAAVGGALSRRILESTEGFRVVTRAKG